jgi:hypothetical protein
MSLEAERQVAQSEGVPPADEPRRDGPVYVGGLDRSGKTTMAGFLGSHPRIAIPAVGSNMWTYFYRRFGDLSDERNLDACLDALWRYKHIRFLDPDIAEIKNRFLAGPQQTYAELFALFLRQFAEGLGKPRWGAQTGLIERHASELFDAYPGLKVVHMVRDPRDRYEASLTLWPDGKGRAGGAAARWLYSERLARKGEKRWPGRYLVVRFEDLVSDPEQTVRAVCDFLDEDFDPVMMSMEASPRHRDRMAEKSNEGEFVSPQFVGMYKERVDPAEAAFIELHARKAMLRRGYTPDGETRFDSARAAFTEWPNQVLRMVAWRTVEEFQQRLPRVVQRNPGRRMILEDAE